MMKRGTKRAALNDSDSNPKEFTLRSKTLMDEPESSRPNLDLKRGESARQHVRALNNQFASWVQLQLQNHPDELWEDGVKDYLSHASHILDKFKDVVEWLRAEAAKSETKTTTAAPLFSTRNNSTPVFGIFKADSKPEVNNGFAQENKSSTFSSSHGSSLLSMNQPSASSSLLQNSTQSSSKDSNLFSTSQPPTSSSMQNSSLSSTPSSGLFSFSQPQTRASLQSLQSSSFSSSQSTGLFNFGQAPVNSNLQSSGLSSSSQSSGLFTFAPKPTELNSSMQSSGLPSSQSSGFFAMNQTPVFGGAQKLTASEVEASEEGADEENEMEQPSSPSLKKTEEKGVVVVHEVKCKVYVKPDDPEDKAWKDMGMGQLSIKCKEGASKAAKESKPTIIIRNDVGRILLNALIYPGIKMNIKKNTIASIFHTSGNGQDGKDEAGKNNVVARTYLLRLKTEDDTTKLAATIQDYAPSA